MKFVRSRAYLTLLFLMFKVHFAGASIFFVEIGKKLNYLLCWGFCILT